MIGGLGFHTPTAPNAGGAYGGAARPLLVPVKFVKAQALPAGLGGDDDKKKVVVGDMELQVKAGVVLPDEEPMEETAPEATFAPQAPVQQPCSRTRSPVSAPSMAPSTPVPSKAPTPPKSLPFQLPQGFVLGLTPRSPPQAVASDSDSESEDIVFSPPGHNLSKTTTAPSIIPKVETRPPSPTTSPPSPDLRPTLLSSFPSPVMALPTAHSSPPFRALSSVSLLPTITAAKLPPKAIQKVAPALKLSKNQKKALAKAGKKARKNGKEHARSGNKHLFVAAPVSEDEDELEDEDDIKAGDAMMDRILGSGVEEMDLGSDSASDEEKPREGDSDLEWGDGGAPPPRILQGKGKVADGRGTNRKERRKAERAEKKENERIERLSMSAREEVALALGGKVVRESRSEIVVEVKGKRKSKADLAAEDYAANVRDAEDEPNSDGEAALGGKSIDDLSFLLSLIGGAPAGQHKTIAELDDDDQAEAEDEDAAGWNTTSGSEISDGSDDEVDSDDELEMDVALGEADAQVELAMAQAEDVMMGEDSGSASDDSSLSSSDEDRAIEAALLSGAKIRFSSMGQGGPGGRKGIAEKKRAKKGKGKAQQSSSEEDSSDEDAGMFRGKGTWADDDEDYIRGLQDIMDENADLLGSRDRKSRKKLFKAIEEGDFRGYDFDDDDFAVASGSSKKSKKKPDFFASELQAQWEKDRSKKGDFKRKRALARAEAEEASPHLRKKGPLPPASFSGSSDAASLNILMREFVLNAGKSSLSLPPMSKKSRVAVHLLAEVYGLKSKSLGKGKQRFPVLERTQRSAVYGVDERKVKAIVGTAAGEGNGKWGGGKQTGKMGGLWAALGGDSNKGPSQRGGGGGAKNREGVVVGVGADKIGSENIGHALLMKMGWKEGEQIGMSGGSIVETRPPAPTLGPSSTNIPPPDRYVRVPPGRCWVEGDEGFHSRDSNDFGPAALGLLKARVDFVLYPFSRFGRVPEAEGEWERRVVHPRGNF
ncbi:hypothetical protein P7C70_g4007, partial [Phenoliferia sp. Uapishka_3]